MNPEDEAQDSPETLGMLKVLGILKPLRQHRQASAERRQRALQAQLDQALGAIAVARKELAAERLQQREKRAQLSAEHCNQVVSLSEIDTWHTRERRMIGHLANLDHGVQQLLAQLEQLRVNVETARLDVKARQRAVEKLACLAEAVEQTR